MKNIKLSIFLSLSFVMVCLFTVTAYASVSSDRLFGQNRYETASKIAECYNNNTVNNVILVSGEDFPDALSASVLAHKISAPILLINSTSDGLSNAFDYINKHLDKSGNVYIIGSAATASANFTSYLNQVGYKNIIEIGSNDRYYTNFMVAQQINVPQNTPVVISSGENYPDALGISSFAAHNNWPILLVPKDTLPDKTSQFLLSDKPSKIYITGGTGVITSNLEEQIQELVPAAKIIRFAGKDRFDTNAQIIQAFVSNPKNIYLSSGYGFADALSGSVLAAQAGDPIVLIDPAANTVPVTIVPLLYSYQTAFQNIISFGGTAVVPESVVTKAKNITSDDIELARAVSLGIGVYRADNPTVTYEQFFKMLDNAVKIADSSKLESWNSILPDVRKSKNSMTRYDGMFSLFLAAEALGGDYFHYNTSWFSMNSKIGDPWKDVHLSSAFSSYGGKDVALDGYKWGYLPTAYFYSFGRVSLSSSRTIFDYDSVSNSMRPSGPFTYKEALCASLRLYDSGLKETQRVPTQEDMTILHQVDDRRDAILNSKSIVTVKGTSYYVSNSGNDNNDGLSPETAWATLDKVNNTTFKTDDGVFFQRGGLWRGRLKAKDYVTFSAYGVGDKPKIYASPEDGADPAKWKLMDGTKNIWVFYKNLPDCGCIVFNGGASYAEKTVPFWNGSEYVDYVNPDGGVMKADVTKLENLHYISKVDLTGEALPVHMWEKANLTGPIYLRCDAGNPGQVYNSIEFSIETPDLTLVAAGVDSTIDNLCIKYGANNGVGYGTSSIIQNCEVAWIGGTTNVYEYVDGKPHMECAGDGVNTSSYGNSAINNYVHDCYDCGINIGEGGAFGYFSDKMGNLTIRDNLVEHCNGGLALDIWPEYDGIHIFKNTVIDNNYVLYSGYGWSYDRHVELVGYDKAQYATAMYIAYNTANVGTLITNNVFYLSRSTLMELPKMLEFRPTYSGNIYVQNNWGFLIRREGDNYLCDYLNLNARNSVIDALGDKTGVVLMPNQ